MPQFIQIIHFRIHTTPHTITHRSWGKKKLPGTLVLIPIWMPPVLLIWLIFHILKWKESSWSVKINANKINGVFSIGIGKSVNSENLINQWNRNWDQFRDPLSYRICCVVTSWYPTQIVVGSNNILYKTYFIEFCETICGNSHTFAKSEFVGCW